MWICLVLLKGHIAVFFVSASLKTQIWVYWFSQFYRKIEPYLGVGQIIGGTVTKRGELSYLAALGYRKLGKFRYDCGGTLINR